MEVDNELPFTGTSIQKATLARLSRPKTFDNKSISPKQSAFLDEYINNGKQASLAYRYIYQSVSLPKSMVHSDRLLALPHIQAELNRRLKLKAEAERIDRGAVLKKINNLLQRSIDSGDKRTELKCLELIANIGNLIPRASNQVNVNTQVNGAVDTYKVQFGTDPETARLQAEQYTTPSELDDIDYEELEDDNE